MCFFKKQSLHEMLAVRLFVFHLSFYWVFLFLSYENYTFSVNPKTMLEKKQDHFAGAFVECASLHYRSFGLFACDPKPPT